MNLLFAYFAISYFAVPVTMTVHSEWRRVFVSQGPLLSIVMALSLLVWPVLIPIVLLKFFKGDTSQEIAK